jgi:hypothetical protein
MGWHPPPPPPTKDRRYHSSELSEYEAFDISSVRSGLAMWGNAKLTFMKYKYYLRDTTSPRKLENWKNLILIFDDM